MCLVYQIVTNFFSITFEKKKPIHFWFSQKVQKVDECWRWIKNSVPSLNYFMKFIKYMWANVKYINISTGILYSIKHFNYIYACNWKFVMWTNLSHVRWCARINQFGKHFVCYTVNYHFTLAILITSHRIRLLPVQ